MHSDFAKRRLVRRIIAIAAAYVIAVSSLTANYAAARDATATPINPGGVICHGVASQSSPVNKDGDSKGCAPICCIGCLTLMVAMPPPPANAVAVARSVRKVLGLQAVEVLIGRPTSKSHQSRAPPQAA